MLGCKGLVLGIPKMYHMSVKDLFRLDFELWVVVGLGLGSLSKNLVKPSLGLTINRGILIKSLGCLEILLLSVDLT